MRIGSVVADVIDNIKMVKSFNREAANELISYYESNKKRIDYKYYKRIGTTDIDTKQNKIV